MTTEKPSIAPEAQHRIRSFVQEVEALQERWGVNIAVESDLIVFRDIRRTDEWIEPETGLSYGDWDAWINHDNNTSQLRLIYLEFEDFDLWGK